MKNRQWIPSFAAGILLIFLFSNGYLKDIGGFSYDTGNFLFSIYHYDLSGDSPHLPGYPLYSFCLKGFNMLLKSPYLSFKWLNLFFTFFSFILAYKIFRKRLDMISSLLYSLFLFSIPYILFFNLVPETYVFDLFYPILLLYLISSDRNKILTGVLVGFLGGFRPPSLILLMPAYIYWMIVSHLKTSSKMLKVKIFLSTMTGILLWLIPLIILSGGPDQYIHLYQINNPKENLSFIQNLARFILYSWTLLIPAGIWFFLMITKKSRTYFIKNEHYFFHILIMLTGFLFFTIIHFSKGYALITAFSTVYLLSVLLSEFKHHKKILSVWIGANLLFFILTPYRLPSQDCFKDPARRESPPAQIALQKAFSFYLCSFSHLKFLERQFDEINNLISNAETRNVFVGPMITLSIRNLAFKFPDHTFYRFRPGHSDIIEKYHAESKVVYDQPIVKDILVILRKDNPVMKKEENSSGYQRSLMKGIYFQSLDIKKFSSGTKKWLGR